MLLLEPVMSSPKSKSLVHVPYSYIMGATLVIPVFSLLAVVTLGVLLHFDKVTSTHCRVSSLNLLPCCFVRLNSLMPPVK